MEALGISLPTIIVCTERILLRSYAKVYAAFPHEGFFVLYYTNFIFCVWVFALAKYSANVVLVHAFFFFATVGAVESIGTLRCTLCLRLFGILN